MAEEVKQEENLVDKAEKAAARLEAANKKAEEMLAENQKIAARQMLGGKSTAGAVQEQKKPVSNREYAEAALKGKIAR